MDHSTRRMIVIGLALSLACACSDETNAGEPSTGGSAGVAGAAGLGGSSGAAGSGMMANGGSGGAAMTPDAGGSGMGGGGMSGSGMGGGGGAAGSGSNPDCPTIAPQPVPGQTIVIAAIWIPQRVVYIQNVSNAPIEITNQPPWNWCAFPAYGQIVGSNRTLAPGERFAISGLDGFSGDVDGAEIAIYDNADFNSQDSMRAYLIWNDPPADGRENVAFNAELWTFNDRATVDPGDVGLFATGPTDEGSGYTSVPASCFPLQP